MRDCVGEKHGCRSYDTHRRMLYTCQACNVKDLCVTHTRMQNHPCVHRVGFQNINEFVTARMKPTHDHIRQDLLAYLPRDVVDHVVMDYIQPLPFDEPCDFKIMGVHNTWDHTFYPLTPPGSSLGDLPLVQFHLQYKPNSPTQPSFFRLIFRNVALHYLGNCMKLQWTHPEIMKEDTRDFFPITTRWDPNSEQGGMGLQGMYYLNACLSKLPPLVSELVGFTRINEYIACLIRYCFIQLKRYQRIYRPLKVRDSDSESEMDVDFLHYSESDEEEEEEEEEDE